MPYMPQMRYINYLEIAEITQQMRLDFKNNQLNSLQKSLFNQRNAEVLYDIENDLWETKNLVKDPKYKTVLSKMRNQLKVGVLKSKDIHFATEYEIGLISKYETPYEYRLDQKKYQFKKIFKAALLSGIRNHNTAIKQIKLLESDNKIVRYWAVVGLMSQEKNTINSYQKKLKNLLADVYPPVAITAAAILYENFRDKESMKVLLKFSKSDNMDLSLMTINYLLYVNDKTPFIETIKDVHTMPKLNYNVKAACMDFLSVLGMVESVPETEN